MRIGQGNNLLCVGRIGKDFLITGDGRINYHLTNRNTFSTNGGATEDTAVFKNKQCGLFKQALQGIPSSQVNLHRYGWQRSLSTRADFLQSERNNRTAWVRISVC